MPRVTIELPSVLAEVARGGVRSIDVEADTLADALAGLTAAHPELAVHLFDESGALRQHVLCFHNETNARWLDDALAARLAAGDVVRILQAVSGG